MAASLCHKLNAQTGFGRMGSNFWCFELHDVIPDIVTCGKVELTASSCPDQSNTRLAKLGIGNGFPMGAVVVTEKVMNAFANGMEYFNTYAGCNAAS
eukprot:scaffold674354_cov50-Prasinocladus_malaysianus.AAC.1